MRIEFKNSLVFFDDDKVKQKAKTQFSGYFEKHSRIFMGINKVKNC